MTKQAPQTFADRVISKPLSEQLEGKITTRIAGILLAVFIAKSLYAHFLGLVPDETYYWDWSRDLSFGYFDHPPMIAWMIYLSTHILGNTVLGIRAFMLLSSCVTIFFTCMLAKWYVSKPSSLYLIVILANSVLLFSVGSLLATPDIPLVLFWSLALYAGYKAIFENATIFWLLLGVFCGLGLLSKYTFGLFFITMLIFLATSTSKRFWLTTWKPYAAGAICILICIPHLVWNIHHQWLPLTFQFSHGVNSAFRIRFDTFGEYIGGQLGLLSILPFVVLLLAIWSFAKQAMANSKIAYCMLFFLVPFTAFLMASLQKKVEANWAAAAYVSGMVLIAMFWDKQDAIKNRGMKRFIITATAFALAGSVVILVHLQTPFLPLAANNDPAIQIRGWKTCIHQIDSIRTAIDPRHELGVAANRYQEASLLGFYGSNNPKAMSLNIGTRANQYPLFLERKKLFLGRFLFIQPSRDSLQNQPFSNALDSIRCVGQVLLHQSTTCQTLYSVYTCVLRKPL